MKYFEAHHVKDFKDAEGSTPEILIVDGNRTGGKTTAFSRMLVDDFLKDKTKFFIVYRYKNDTEDVAEAFFKDIKTLFFPDHYMTSRKHANGAYTELFLDGRKGKWASMDSAKSMGEEIGCVTSISKDKTSVTLKLRDGLTGLNNGDGFSFVAKDGTVCGFRGDVCSGNIIRCKSTAELFAGARIYRNIDISFEKEIDRKPCIREIRVNVTVGFLDGKGWAAAETEDGRKVRIDIEPGDQIADNQERMKSMIMSQIGKSAGHYRFSASEIKSDCRLPFLSASALNGIRRSLAEELDKLPCIKRDILHKTSGRESYENNIHVKDASYRFNISNKLAEKLYRDAGIETFERAYELEHQKDAELMRTKYCVRHELGLCPKQQRGKQVSAASPLYILNNGQRFVLKFDCRNCEMIVTA